jgi:hypothetical protein
MMRTSELTGAALDWAVAKCEGYTDLHKIDGRMAHEPQLGMYPPRRAYGVMDLFELGFSTDWAQGGPIIERQEIGIRRNAPCSAGREWEASPSLTAKGGGGQWGYGPTPLIAAMRCYVASKLGEDIDIPEELTP